MKFNHHSVLSQAAVLAFSLASVSTCFAQTSSGVSESIATTPSAQVTVEDPNKARLPMVNRDELDEHGKIVYDASTKSDPRYENGIPAPVGMWMYAPELAENLIPVRNYFRTKTTLGTPIVELAILVTSREMNNQYEYTAHEPLALKAGVRPEAVDVVKYRKDPSQLEEKEALVVRFGRELIGDKKVTSDTFNQAVRVFGKRGTMELSATMGFYNFIYTTIVTFDVHRDDKTPLLPVLKKSGHGK